MDSRSRVLMASVVTTLPGSFLKYRLAPTTAAPRTTTASAISMFLRDISGSLRSTQRCFDSGNHHADRHVDDDERGGNRRGAPLIEDPEPDGEADQPPEHEQIDRAQRARGERGVVEERREHGEVR